MKIFGIGLSKTGTTSLANALLTLGFRTKDNIGVERFRPHDLCSIDEDVLATNDAFTDTPIPSLYRELDLRYPNSKFILTIRDMDDWLKSCKKQFNQKLAEKQTPAHNQLFIDLYGCSVFEEEKFRAGYDKFVRGVFDYFENRPDDLLVIDLTAGEGWEKLCAFLNKQVPSVPFPKSNVTKIRWLNVLDVVTIAKEVGDDVFNSIGFLQEWEKKQPLLGSFSPRRVSRMLQLLIKHRRKISLESVLAEAFSQIDRRLNNISPSVPVVFPNRYDVPYTDRRNWNHFWLVDILIAPQQSCLDTASYSVSIALIEDRTPFLGVVYSPAVPGAYYAVFGKGAFKLVDSGKPIELGQCRSSSNLPPDSSRRSHATFIQSIEGGGQSAACLSLSLCHIAEGHPARYGAISKTFEWQTAAAHAILRSVGLQLRDISTNEDLEYNKDHWRNPDLCVQ